MQVTPNEFTTEFTVQGFECDMHRRMLPGAMLRRVQQISTDHCNALGFTQETYANAHTAFLMAKLGMEIYRAPRLGEKVILHTRPTGAQRAVFTRHTCLYAKATQQAQPLCAVDARWILVDTDTHRILRQPPESLHLSFAAQEVPRLEIAMVKAVQLERAGQEQATYTRCDQYQHMNNTVYADIVCDALPLAIMEKKRVTRLLLSFHREVPLGAHFMVYRGETTRSSHYLCGKTTDALHFEAEVFLRDIPAEDGTY